MSIEGVENMKAEYDFSDAKKNPYVKKLKKQITINIDTDVETVEYFKSQAENSGIPYQMLMSLYLSDCVSNNRQLQMSWK